MVHPLSCSHFYPLCDRTSWQGCCNPVGVHHYPRSCHLGTCYVYEVPPLHRWRIHRLDLPILVSRRLVLESWVLFFASGNTRLFSYFLTSVLVCHQFRRNSMVQVCG